MYEVLGKSVSHSRNVPKDPVKKLRVRLSVCKERGKEETEITRRECLLSASGTQEHHKRTRAKTLPVDKADSVVANPPSTDNIDSLLQQTGMASDPVRGRATDQRRKGCKKCDQRCPEKDRHTCNITDMLKMSGPVIDSHGRYHYPKRMQTGPGECHPTVSMDSEMARVKAWVNQCCESHGHDDNTKTEEHHRHKHRSRSHRHHSCQHNSCETNCDVHHSSQYLDLATDHVTFPYHVDDQSHVFTNASPRPQHRHKQNETYHCRHTCHQEARPVIHRHEHRHHHSHHHYHHHIS